MMTRIALTLHFTAPLSSTTAELTSLKNNYLEPLITLLERGDSLRVQVCISGILSDYLEAEGRKLLGKIAALSARDQLDILVAPRFDPELGVVSVPELTNQLDRGIDLWKEHSSGRPFGAFLPAGWKEGIPEALIERGNRIVVVNSNALTEEAKVEVQGATRERTKAEEFLIPPAKPAIIARNGAPIENIPKKDTEYLVVLPATPLTVAFEPELPPALRGRSAGIDAFLDSQIIKKDTDPRIFTPLLTFEPALFPLLGESGERFQPVLERLFLRASVSAQLNFLRISQLLSQVVTRLKLSTSAEKGYSLLSTSSFQPPRDVSASVTKLFERKRLFYRVLHLAEELDPLPGIIKSQGNEGANTDRLQKAKHAFSTTLSRELYSDDPLTGVPSHRLRRALMRAVLVAQVESDTIRNPEVDPSVGWVRLDAVDYDQDGEDELVVDSQLLRLYIERSQGARIIEIDYKPRKADLANTFSADNTSAVSRFMLLQPGDTALGTEVLRELVRKGASHSAPATMSVTKRSKDLLELSFRSGIPTVTISREGPPEAERSYSALIGQTQVVSHLQVKAGIGAHLANSTTGLATEFWLEGVRPAAGTLLITQWSLMLPSGDPGVLSFRPLTAAGGAHDHAFGCDDDYYFGSSDITGGCHGVRLIDGVENLIVELRTSKPVTFCSVLPLWSPTRDGGRVYGGSTVLLGLDATRFYGDAQSCTLFMSIK